MMIILCNIILILWWVLWLVPWQRLFSPLASYTCRTIIFVACIVGTVRMLYWYDDLMHPIVEIRQSCQVYIGPEKGYLTCGSIEKGKKVQVLQRYQQWLKVKCDNTIGWLFIDAQNS